MLSAFDHNLDARHEALQKAMKDAARVEMRQVIRKINKTTVDEWTQVANAKAEINLVIAEVDKMYKRFQLI